MRKRHGIKNFLKTSLAALGKTFNPNIVRVISSVMEEKQPIEFGHDDTKAIGLVPKTMKNFSVPLVEHCNLRCCGCDHFAPLAEPEFAEMGVFENDFARLSYLVNGEMEKIGLMGGEPLLHPKVKDFLYIARRYFQKSRIRIVTNGVLLLKQKEDFWNACRENNIIIEVTKYPINLDFDKMKVAAGSYDVLFTFRENTEEGQKASNYIPLDLDGEQDSRRNFMKCFHANNAIFLNKGRLYTCTVAPNIHHFNKFFDKDIKASPTDSIDIYEAQSAKELFQFLSKPIPFCRYCHVDKRTFGHPWKRSRKDIKEWTA
ncbi:MAG: radical SAM protein [Smithellaceae bacterium]